MSTLELYRIVFGVDELIERIRQLERENARLVAEAERMRRLADRPVWWTSPTGPYPSRGTGLPDAPEAAP